MPPPKNNNNIFSNNICNTLSWNGTIWVAGGEGNVPISHSNDGINWTPSSTSNILFTNNICNSIDWNGTYFIAGGKGDNPIGYSSDGIIWIQDPTTNYNYNYNQNPINLEYISLQNSKTPNFYNLCFYTNFSLIFLLLQSPSEF